MQELAVLSTVAELTGVPACLGFGFTPAPRARPFIALEPAGVPLEALWDAQHAVARPAGLKPPPPRALAAALLELFEQARRPSIPPAVTEPLVPGEKDAFGL